MTRTAPRLGIALAAVAALAVVSAPLTTASADASAPQAAKAAPRGSTPAKSTPAKSTPAKAAPSATTRTSAEAANDFRSIFTGQVPSLVNSGWSTCAAPVTWSLDAADLTDAEVAGEVANFQWAFDQWAQSAGLTFTYVGRQQMRYDDAAFTLTPADGSGIVSRHIYLAFVTDAASDRMGGGTVGLASPSQVFPTSKEIVNGAAVFRIDHVRRSDDRALRSLYIHELGHIMGLAHATESANVMYPVVTDNVALGAGDANGVRAMVKPCAEPVVAATDTTQDGAAEDDGAQSDTAPDDTAPDDTAPVESTDADSTEAEAA